MSSEETTGQIEVVEQPAKPKQIIKIFFKKLYKNELTRRKNVEIILEQQKKILNDNKIEIETLKQNLETKNKELIDLKKQKVLSALWKEVNMKKQFII